MQPGAKTLLLIVLLLALPFAAYMLVFKKLAVEIDNKVQETQQKQQQLNDLSTALARSKDLPSDIAKLKKVISFLEAKLPQDKDMDGVIKEFWQIAGKNGLNTRSIRTLKVIPNASYSEQPIKINIVGTFSPGVFNFLRDVEQLPRLTRISDMKISADEKVPGQVSAEIIVTIYFEAAQKVAVAQ